jgi:hypothetical protein
MSAPRLRLTFAHLPTGFARTPEAGERIGLQPRMMRNHAMQEEIALKVTRPMGGVEWAVHEAGAAALRRGDTGDVCDARRVVATFAALAEDLWPGDTGPIDAARRAVANLNPGDT